MIRLRDIMTTEVLTVGPDMSVRDAMLLLADHHVSGVPVVSGRAVVGVVTANDLMEYVAALPEAPAEREEEVAWGAWTNAGEDVEAEVPEAENAPLGSYFTELWTEAGSDVDVRFDKVSAPEPALDEHTVSEVMTRSPIWQMPPDAAVPAAADYMSAHKIHRLLVMHDATLLGIVTTTDISNAVAQHKLTSRTFVFDAGSRFDKRGWGREE
jgi:CBS domain-containing protein